MEEYIYQIRGYLPIKFVDEEANDFLNYLEETYLENIKNKKFQFAFKAFHMLYMTFIYKTNWFIKKIKNEDPEEITYKLEIKSDGQAQAINEKISIKQMFEFSLISEVKVIHGLLQKTGFHPNDFNKCKNHVDARNYCSHASGKIEYDYRGIDFLISDELKYIERLQKKVKPDLKNLLEKFLNENWDKSFIGGDIENWFEENHISEKDLEILTKFSLSLFKKKSDNEKNVYQKLLYLIFVFESQKHIETEKSIFLENLPMLMKEMKDEIKVIKEGKEKTIYTQEIIIEKLTPLINDLSGEKREEAEIILNLF